MSNGTPLLSATTRALVMLEAAIVDCGNSTISALARATNLPVATAHRQVATLVANGFLASTGNGRHIAGPRLRALLERVDDKQVIANIAAPMLHRLATTTGTVAQLGTFENDMVTYRIKAGIEANTLFTQVGMQLEAYCSGMGKVLLAYLPKEECETYLATGPFVALTAKTITAPDDLRLELARIRDDGFACDDGEISVDLYCLAVPIHKPGGVVPAAISVSWLKRPADIGPQVELMLDRVRKTAKAIEERAFPTAV